MTRINRESTSTFYVGHILSAVACVGRGIVPHDVHGGAVQEGLSSNGVLQEHSSNWSLVGNIGCHSENRAHVSDIRDRGGSGPGVVARNEHMIVGVHMQQT